MKRAAALALATLLAACGSKPQAPEWRMNAHGALERYEASFLAGEQRAAEADFLRARRELAATGQASLVARAELTRCALQVASLVFEPCGPSSRCARMRAMQSAPTRPTWQVTVSLRRICCRRSTARSLPARGPAMRWLGSRTLWPASSRLACWCAITDCP